MKDHYLAHIMVDVGYMIIRRRYSFDSVAQRTEFIKKLPPYATATDISQQPVFSAAQALLKLEKEFSLVRSR